MGAAFDKTAGFLDGSVLLFVFLLFAVFALFSLERALHRLALMLRVRGRWYPEGRFVLFCCSDDDPARGYVEGSVLPEIQDSAVVYRPPRGVFPKRGGPFEAKVARAFFGTKYEGPFALVFKPYFEYERVEFAGALARLAGGDDFLIKKVSAKLFEMVEAQRERMSIYI